MPGGEDGREGCRASSRAATDPLLRSADLTVYTPAEGAQTPIFHQALFTALQPFSAPQPACKAGPVATRGALQGLHAIFKVRAPYCGRKAHCMACLPPPWPAS